MNVVDLIKLYNDAEKRATPCAGGKSFQPEDRLALIKGMVDGGIDVPTLARSISGSGTTVKDQAYHVAYCRLATFLAQARRGSFRIAGYSPEKVLSGPSVAVIDEQPFDGRIKTRADIQPAFNRAAQQLARLGINNVAEAQAYLANGFESIRVQQKIDQSAERVLRELQIGQLSKEQVLAVLEKVKSKF